MVLKIKKLGSKKFSLIDLELSIVCETLNDFLIFLVKKQIEDYSNNRENIITFLSLEDLEEKVESGRVTFGSYVKGEKIDLNVAIENALLAFKDGLFSVFIDGLEIKELNQKLELNDNSEVVFIKFTFLAGV